MKVKERKSIPFAEVQLNIQNWDKFRLNFKAVPRIKILTPEAGQLAHTCNPVVGRVRRLGLKSSLVCIASWSLSLRKLWNNNIKLERPKSLRKRKECEKVHLHRGGFWDSGLYLRRASGDSCVLCKLTHLPTWDALAVRIVLLCQYSTTVQIILTFLLSLE